MTMTPATGTRRTTIETAALDRTRRRLAQFFMANHALSPEDAIYFSTTTAADEKVFLRMQRQGLIHDAGRKRYYLDLDTYDAHIDRRRRWGVIVAVTLSVLIAVVAMLLYRDVPIIHL